VVAGAVSHRRGGAYEAALGLKPPFPRCPRKESNLPNWFRRPALRFRRVGGMAAFAAASLRGVEPRRAASETASGNPPGQGAGELVRPLRLERSHVA